VSTVRSIARSTRHLARVSRDPDVRPSKPSLTNQTLGEVHIWVFHFISLQIRFFYQSCC